MGHIKEPKGIDLVVNPMPLSDEDRKAISSIIAQYKKTGNIPKPLSKDNNQPKKNQAPSKSRNTKKDSPKSKKAATT